MAFRGREAGVTFHICFAGLPGIEGSGHTDWANNKTWNQTHTGTNVDVQIVIRQQDGVASS